jgi:hypothetical protein
MKAVAKKYDNGGKAKTKKGIAQSDTLERSPEQVRENASQQVLLQRPEKTYEEKLEEARLRRERNARINKRRDASGRDKKGAPRLDDQNLRNKDGSPLRGGPTKTPIAPKEIPTKTPKKTLNKSKAVIPVPTKKELRERKRKNKKNNS